MLQWPVRESRIQRWQTQLADMAKSDFRAIEQLKSEWGNNRDLEPILSTLGKGCSSGIRTQI